MLLGSSGCIFLSAPLYPHLDLSQELTTMLDGIFRDGKVYKKAGVIVSGIEPEESCSTTLSLFAEEASAADERDRRIMKVMDDINLRFKINYFKGRSPTIKYSD